MSVLAAVFTIGFVLALPLVMFLGVFGFVVAKATKALLA